MYREKPEYEITASMCGFQCDKHTFERVKDTSNLFIALFWFIVFIAKYPMAYITHRYKIPKCGDCENHKRCEYEVDGI